MPRVPGQVVEAVHLANGGQAPTDGGGREAGEVGTERRGVAGTGTKPWAAHQVA